MQRKLPLSVAAMIVLAVVCLTTSALAYPNGVSGASGKSGSTCTMCHSSGSSKPTVTISGPMTVTSGSTNAYTLSNNGTPNSGLDVGASAGTFSAGSGTQVMSGEITQTSAATSTPLSWSFNWTAPTVTTATTVSMYGASISGGYGGSTGSAVVTITVNPAATAPTITTQPANQTVTAGQTATFSVVASGTGLSYQWRKNGTNISGATSSSYTTPATATTDSGSTFSVAVSNAGGSVTSNNATLTVNAAAVVPSITSQPASPTVTAGQTASFSVAANGTAPLSYQWRKNGTNISGATSSSYTTPATATADSGSTFSVVVTNSAGSATSNNATLTVNAAAVAPSITAQPASQTVTAGQTATFSVSANGTAPLSYQWRKNGTNISGATSSSYTTPATATTDSGSTFSVVVTNSAGSATSNNAVLNVNAAAVAPSITTQPGNQSVTAGQTATFSVSATGTAPMSYQWRKNGTSISGATASSYTTPATSMTDSGSTFSVSISNSAGSVTSNNATLTVNQAAPIAPSIATQPASQTVTVGQTATFSVLATGTGPLSYQWRMNGTNVSGANGSSYTTSATTTGMSGSAYSVVVSNSAGSVTSGNAMLTVNSSTGTGSGKLVLSADRLVFYADRSLTPSPKRISVTSSSGGALNFTVDMYGGSWMTVSPTAGATPGTITVSAYPAGLTAGTYSCVIKVSAGSSTRRVYVVLVVARGDDDGEDGGGHGGGHDDSAVRPFHLDPGVTGTTDAMWMDGYGVPVASPKDPTSQGLVLTRNPSAAKSAIAGAVLKGAAGSQLSRLSFDLRSDSECTAKAPQFVIVTTDEVVHKASCASGTVQSLTVPGWQRVSFDPANSAQLSPAVTPGMAVKTIALVMDQPVGSGMAVVDNINVNGRYIGRE